MWPFDATTTIVNDRERQQPTAPSSEVTTQTLPSTEIVQPATQPLSTRPGTRTPVFSQRSLSQLGFFAAGASFLALSTFVTRRAVVRKQMTGMPLFFGQSNRPSSKVGGDGGLVAVEALGLATLNTMCFGIMLTGGISWAFDISNLEELRSAARKHTRPGLGDTDEDAEREIAEYFSKILAGNDEKGDSTTLEKAFGTLVRQKGLKDNENPEVKP